MFKILVVEDNEELNKTVCSFLNHSGYEATGCLNAVEGYGLLKLSLHLGAQMASHHTGIQSC